MSSSANVTPDPLPDRLRCCWGSGACHSRSAFYVETDTTTAGLCERHGRQWMCEAHARRTLSLIAERRAQRKAVRS